MPVDKRLLFISHSNPGENYFAAWLASKLRILGYETWVDVKNIPFGNPFWQEINRKIREDAAVFIAIISKNYIEKYNSTDSGVYNEIEIARTLLRQNPNFIIPIKYGDAKFSDLPPGIIGKNAVNNDQNWAATLRDLLRELDERKIPRGESEKENILSFWQESLQINFQALAKQERYYTNWFRVIFTSEIFVHKLVMFNENRLGLMPYPYVREGDLIVTFASTITIKKYLEVEHSQSLPWSALGSRSIALNFPMMLTEPNKKLVGLLNKTLDAYLRKRNLSIFHLSGEKACYHFEHTDENAKQISLKRYNKNSRTVVGRQRENYWHFGISFNAALFPFPHYKFSYHVIFKDSTTYLDYDQQHALRRGLSDWYNRKWFELLLSFVLKVGYNTNEEFLRVNVDDNVDLRVNVLPESLLSTFGYNEPNSE